MKTAMQELMEWMEKTEFMVNRAFIDKINECLELEKEQIIVAHNFGYLVGEDSISIKDANMASEKYYALTFNQLPSQSKTLFEILDIENEKNIINDIIDKSNKNE
jgi:hypothetical protein